MSNNWIAVASADHVGRGVAGGFMQVCHGKEAPLRRLEPGDRISYYSPTVRFGASRWLRAFTAFGTVADGAQYPVLGQDGGTFHRRDVVWIQTKPVSIYDLLAQLDLTAGRSDWGVQFRYGLLRIGDADAARIAAAMGVALGEGATRMAA